MHFQFNCFASTLALGLKSAGIVLTIYFKERALTSENVIDVNHLSFKAIAVVVTDF